MLGSMTGPGRQADDALTRLGPTWGQRTGFPDAGCCQAEQSCPREQSTTV